MTTYTTPHSLPIKETADKIAAPTEGLRQDLNALATAANTAITAEGTRAESAAKADASTKFGGLPARVTAVEDKNDLQDTAIAAARTNAVADAKTYTDAQIAAAKVAVAWDKGVLATDMNTVQSSGRWAVNDTTLPNRPVAVSGELESAWGDTTGVHRYTTREDNPRVYYRRFTAGNFTPWGKGETGLRLDAIESAKFIPEWKANTAYTAGQRVIAPNGDVVTAKAAFTSVASYSAANWNGSTQDGRVATLETDKWKKADIGSGGDLNTLLTPGNYAYTSTSALNRPDASLGNVNVVKLSGFTMQTAATYSNPQRIYTRYWNGAVWSAWDNLKWRLPNISTASFDVDTLVELGTRSITTTSAVNSPVTGVLFGVTVYPVGNFVGQYAVTYESTMRHFNRRQSGASWTAWEEMSTATQTTDALNTAKAYTDTKVAGVAAGAGLELVGGGSKTEQYEDIVRRGKGGVIGVKGKGAFAFRFDHNLDEFKANVWPLFVARGLPGSFHVLSDSIGNPAAPVEPTTGTWADLKLLHYQGLEMWAHSATHSNPAADKDLTYEIVSPRTAITTNGMRCMGWSTPGGPATYGGSLSTPDNMDSEAGRLIRANYGLYETSMQGTTRRVLPTNGCRGHDHLTLDSMTAADAIAEIDKAVLYGYGIEFMMHPNAIGQAGRLSVAGLAEILDRLVTLRNAGTAEILTSAGLAFADPGTDRRLDLIPAGGTGAQVTFPVRQFGLDGHTFTLTGEVRSVAGGTGHVEVLSDTTQLLSKPIPVSASSAWSRVNIPFLAAKRDANVLTLNFTSAAGAVEWRNLHAYPV